MKSPLSPSKVYIIPDIYTLLYLKHIKKSTTTKVLCWNWIWLSYTAKTASRVKWHHQECLSDTSPSQFTSVKSLSLIRFWCSGRYFTIGNEFFAQILSENSILIGNPSRKVGKILDSSLNTEVHTLKMDFICIFYRIIIAMFSYAV